MKMPMVISLFVISICMLAAAQLWVSHLRVDVAQQLVKLAQERDVLQQDVQGLKLELASLMRPDTLRRLAREKMGMRPPAPMQVVKPW